MRCIAPNRFLAFAILSWTLASVACAQNPSVTYSIDIIPTPGEPDRTRPISEINNLGMVVGKFNDPLTGASRPYLFRHTDGLFYDLNQISSLLAQIPGSSFFRVVAINDSGDFTGTIIDATGTERAVAVETGLSTNTDDWTVINLPDMSSEKLRGIDINAAGDILVQYWVGGTTDLYVYNPWLDTPTNPHPPITLNSNGAGKGGVLNNLGQVAYAGDYFTPDEGSAFIFDSATLQTTTIVVSSEPGDKLQVSGFNDAGAFSGYAGLFSSLGKNTAFRYDQQFQALPSPDYPTWTEMEGESQGINNSGDVHFYDRTERTRRIKKHRFSIFDAYLVHTGFSSNPNENIWNLDDLVSPADPLRDFWFDATIKQVWAMSDRSDVEDATGYPLLGVWLIHPQNDGTETRTAAILKPIGPIEPEPGIAVDPASGLTTTEGGGTDSFSVRLNTQPTAEVTIGISSSKEEEGVVDQASLTFTPAKWNTPQTVIVAGVDDAEPDGDIEYTINLAASGGDYEGLTADVSVTNQDDEVSNITMSVDDPSIVEGDRGDQTGGQFTITLSGASSSDVQVWYQVSNGSARNKDYQMVDPASGLLTFNPGETSKNVSFVILGDTRREPDETFTIELTDAFGATISKSIGKATIIDND